jgi:hypothetical protein
MGIPEAAIIRMDLTTANGGDPSKLSDRFEELIRRIKRKTGVEDIQYWKIRYEEERARGGYEIPDLRGASEKTVQSLDELV